MKQWKRIVVLSLGGSLVVPNGGVDISFLAKFNDFIRRYVRKNWRFFIIVGGGATCRQYQYAAKKVQKTIRDTDLDWLGIHTTRANAHLVRTIFQDIARPRVFDQYEVKEDIGDFPVLIGAGWKPGFSTDYDAVALCRFYNAKEVITMTNIPSVYTDDPRRNPQAKTISRITWKKYRNIIGNTWKPGLSTPFDPVASRLAQKLKITVFVLDGRDLENVEHALKGNKFRGTIIS